MQIIKKKKGEEGGQKEEKEKLTACKSRAFIPVDDPSMSEFSDY
jgi:hypothetical protein